MRHRFTIIAASLLTAACGAVWANTPQNMSPGEIARLPEYCADVQSIEMAGTPDSPTPRQRRWVGLMGNTFWALHHYCWALLNANRASAAGLRPEQKRHLMEWAITDCYYVIKLAPRDFPLLPEILMKVGRYSLELGKFVDALRHFEMSRDVKPDYWPAYAGIADVNLAIGRKAAAVEALEAGLKVVPSEPNLSEQLKRVRAGGSASGQARSRAASAEP